MALTGDEPTNAPATDEPYDLLVIGGGINGVGVARDAAGRGLSVLLCERGDLGGATSSVSSKLLHGGLRYLEQYQFRMVRHALSEREVLLNAAPHIVQPLRFVLPHNPSIRPFWMIRIGMWLYDRLAKRDVLPGSHRLDFHNGDSATLLKPSFERGFEYSDCWVDDARLVVLSAIDAENRGAKIRPRTACTGARWNGDVWEIELSDMENGKTNSIRARFVVNAAGPWAESVAREILQVDTSYRSRLVKGSHIVVPKLFEDGRAYILQNDDRRIVFVLPFEQRFTLIGTTDIPFDGDPSDVSIDADEIDYLCQVVNQHFTVDVSAADVVWSFSGVRPLYDDGSSSASSVSRDYVLEKHAGGSGPRARALTIWGGKLTGYRLLAEDVLDQIAPNFSHIGPAWTADATLPGGNLHPPGLDRFSRMLTQVYDWMPPDLAGSYARRYGTLVHSVLGNSASVDDLGPELSPGLYAREVDYLCRAERARTAEDILWRRTKLGLLATPASRNRLNSYLKGEPTNE
ncbi:MAG: glycerol-3-phosphate dehydrogenase [Thermomicrobiales bacterium]